MAVSGSAGVADGVLFPRFVGEVVLVPSFPHRVCQAR